MHHIQLHTSTMFINFVVNMNFFPILLVGGHSVSDVICHTFGHQFIVDANRNECPLRPFELKGQRHTLVCQESLL